MDDADAQAVTGRIPHYAIPNQAALLPEYINSEAEVIHQAFVPANCMVADTTITKSLPEHIRPQFKAEQKKVLVDTLKSTAAPQSPIKPYQPVHSPSFSSFEYLPSEIDAPKQARAAERATFHAKVRAAGHDRSFVPAVAKDRIPCPRHTPDPVECVVEAMHADRVLQQARILAGPFVPAGPQPLEAAPTKASLHELLVQLRRALGCDWGPGVAVMESDKEHIVVEFRGAGVGDKAVGAYMNVFARTHDVCDSFRLVKLPEFWGVLEDGAIQFHFRPPWAKHR